MAESLLVTVTQAAKILGVPPRQVRDWGKQGHIGFIQTGPACRMYFQRAELPKLVKKLMIRGE